MQLGSSKFRARTNRNDDGSLTPWWSTTMTASWSQMPSWVYKALAIACVLAFAASETEGEDRALELRGVNTKP